MKIRIIELEDLVALKDAKIEFTGMVTKHEKKTTKTGKPYCLTKINDESGETTIYLFHEQAIKIENRLAAGKTIKVNAEIIPVRFKPENEKTIKYLTIEVDNQVVEL